MVDPKTKHQSLLFLCCIALLVLLLVRVGWEMRYAGLVDMPFVVDLLMVTSDHNLSSIRVAMLFKLELVIQCILKLSLGWVEALLNSQSGVIIAGTSGTDEILFIEKG